LPDVTRRPMGINRKLVMKVLVALIMSMGLIFALGSAPAQGAFSGSNGRVLLSKKANGCYDLFTVRVDGTTRRRITDTPACEDNGSWSPDGRHIAFARDGNLYVMRSNGSRVRRVTDSGKDISPSWGPHRHLFFTRRLPTDSGITNYEIFKIGLDGTHARRLTRLETLDSEAVWSRSRKLVAFVSTRRNGDEDIFTMHSNGKRVTRVTSKATEDDTPDWSPDGRRIVFNRQGRSGSSLCTIRPDGTGARKLLERVGDPLRPQWSPDGRLILFQARAPAQLFTIRPDGTHMRRRTHDKRRYISWDWQPLP
jgi:TolB protein